MKNVNFFGAIAAFFIWVALMGVVYLAFLMVLIPVAIISPIIGTGLIFKRKK